jgi:UDPglucose 6-dehydrogenase
MISVSVAGTGYVGLVSGTCLADLGHSVVCVDMDETKVRRINAGDPPIYERGLEEMLARNVGSRLRATTDLRTAVLETDLTLIAVGTPFDGEEIDLRYIRQVSMEIGAALAEKPGYHVVVVKSTVVPGTTEDVVIPALEAASGKVAGRDFGVGMNPEFLREGEAIHDFMNPDRIVLGGIDDRTIGVMDDLYACFPRTDKVRTSPRMAEMIKYAANSLLATLISFSNEIGNLCARLGGIDVVEVMRGVHLDRRLSPILPDGARVTPGFTTYLEAGCGFGGSCFPKDVKALVAHGRKAGAPMDILDAVVTVNRRQPGEVLRILRDHHPELSGLRVAVLGIAFKPGTDDLRESPSLPILRDLVAAGARVSAFDPQAMPGPEERIATETVTYASSMESCIADAEVIVLLTRWEEFLRLPELLAGQQPQPLVVDGRRMLDKRVVERYAGIGL